MSVQTSYSEAPAIGRVGARADSRFAFALTCVAAGLVAVGRSVFRVPSYGARGAGSNHQPTIVYQAPDPAGALDVDAILATGGASATSVGTFDQADADGVVGAGIMVPARKPTITFNSHADWDATTGTMRYYNQDRELVSETFSIPNGGNATVTLTGDMSEYYDVSIPAQTGTNGTFTIGIAVLDSSITIADWEGVAELSPMMAGTGSSFDGTEGEEIDDKEVFSALRTGSMWVVTEDACNQGGAVYTRIAGTGDFGAFRSDADTANAIVIPNARWGMNSSAGGFNKLEMY